MSVINGEKRARHLTTGVAKSSRRALITSTALALLLTVGGAVAADNPQVFNSGLQESLTGAEISVTGIGNPGGGGPYKHGVIVYDNGSSPTIVDVTNSTITTTGISAHGIQVGQHGNKAEGSVSSVITLNDDVTVTTNGSLSYALHAVEGGTINSEATIITKGASGFGAFAESHSKINLTGGTISTKGTGGVALLANNDVASGVNPNAVGGIITAENLNVTTEGGQAVGALAAAGATIDISNSQITTDGDQAHGLVGAYDGKITINDVDVEINTAAKFTYGAYATQNGSIIINDGSITTDGERGYGLLADYGGSIISSADITTNGKVAHAVQAGASGTNTIYDGTTQGTVTLTGGTITVNADNGTSWGAALHAVDSGVINASNITIQSSSYAAFAESESAISVSDSIIKTSGAQAALLANNDLRKDHGLHDRAGGKLVVANTSVTTSGIGSHGASAEWGGAITINGGSISTTGEGASALRVLNSGTIEVTGTQLSSANAATIAVALDDTGHTANVTLGAGTVATANNGTLLNVSREGGGSDGEVNLILGAGSTSTGDIVDQGTKTAGGTDVTLQDGASWSGKLSGVRNFVGFQGGSVDFTERAEISGSLNGYGTSYSFSPLGGSIGGSVNLNDGSSTTGGSIDNRIEVVGDVNVDRTSILGGNWSIGGDLTSSGILRPGNSIGRVNVGDELTLSASSVYQVDVDQSGDADLITVANAANLDGTVVVTPMDGYKLASPYTILTAGSINGEFTSASLAQPSDFIDANLAHGATDVTLTIDRNSTSFASAAATANHAAVARALDKMELAHPVATAIALSSLTEARDAFQQLAGDTNASVKTGLIETANLTADAINNRLRAAFDGVGAKEMPVLSFAQSSNSAAGNAIGDVSAASPSYNYAFWATGFGSWIDHDGNSNTGGMKTSAGGFLSGLDVGFASGWRLGIVGGYSETNMDAKGRHASTKADNWHLGIYGGNQWGALGVRGGLIHTWHDVDASRSVVYGGLGENLSADYDARTLQAFAEVGYQIDMAPVALEPFANLSHIRLRTDGYTESGGDAALAVTSETTNTTFTTLGLRASAPFELGNSTANLKGTIGWRHAYGDRTPIATQAFAGGDAFTVQGVPIAKDAALFEAGMDFHISQAATFGISYVGQFGSKATQNGFNATFKVNF